MAIKNHQQKSSLLKLAGLVLIAGAMLYGGIRHFSLKPKQIIEVPIARARYSDGNILGSKGFITCSAVILDHKNKAIMAHAPAKEYTRYAYEWGIPPEGDSVYTENVVEFLSNQMQERGIDPRECKAFVNSGSRTALESITQGLNASGINVEESRLDEKSRDISYDPINDKIQINYINNKRW